MPSLIFGRVPPSAGLHCEILLKNPAVILGEAPLWLKRRDVSATDEMAAILKHTNVDMRRGLTTFFRSLKPVDLGEPESYKFRECEGRLASHRFSFCIGLY